MTPLAARLLKALTLPARKRPFLWNQSETPDLIRRIPGAHCFEVHEAINFMLQLAPADKTKPLDDMFDGVFFLPSPKTFLEFRAALENAAVVVRVGLLLEQVQPHNATVTFFDDFGAYLVGEISTTSADYVIYKGAGVPNYYAAAFGTSDINAILAQFMSCAHMALVAINSPKVLAQTSAPTNKGAIRRARQLGLANLHPTFTEVKIEITKPRDIGDDDSTGVLTGTRALHFCRKHVRIRRGRMEYVSAHWRGNAANGVRTPNYTVTP
jgi:hypothetical protein